MVERMRFGGMASGLDTENIIKKLMSAERMKVDKYFQQRTRQTWRQEQFNELNKSYASFIVESKKKMGLTTRTSNGVTMPSSYETSDWVNKATISDDKVATIKANATATKGKYTLEVKQLAEGVKFSGTGKLDGKTKIGSLMDSSAFTGGKLNIVINDKDITINSTDNMSQVAKKIKEATGLNARFDDGSGKFFVGTAGTGSESVIKFGRKDDILANENTNKFLQGINLGNTGFDGTAVTELKGKNAIIRFDGSEDIEYQNNNISIVGLDITLKSTTTSPAEIGVTTDVDSIVDKVKGFVEEYNKIIDATNKKLGEKASRSYQPLTDEQREAMKEKDIELWEKKAKAGLLHKDPILTRAMQSVRDGLYEPVYDVTKNADGSYSKTAIGSLYELGIETANWRENGKLTIDEDKLRKAIGEDPEKAMKILFKSSDIPETRLKKDDYGVARDAKNLQNKERQSGMGIISRIYDRMTDAIQDIVNESGPGEDAGLLKNVKQSILLDYVTKGSKSRIDKNVFDLNKIIDDQNRKLGSIEDRYWKKFTALEKAMQQMQSQSGWIAQQMGGMAR